MSEHNPSSTTFNDRWSDSDEDPLNTEVSSVASSTDATQAAGAIWPAVVRMGLGNGHGLPSSEWVVGDVSQVWLPGADTFGSQSADEFWSGMEPTDTYAVVMRHPRTGGQDGFGMARKGATWQYNTGIVPWDTLADAMSAVRQAGGDPASARILSQPDLAWLVYPTEDTSLEARLLAHSPESEIFIDGRRVESLDLMPWQAVRDPYEQRWPGYSSR